MREYRTSAKDLKLALLHYFRFKRQCICVDEFRGADIIADTGKTIIEVEIKLTKTDLINGERKKSTKHQAYKLGDSYQRNQPNLFLFCVPESLVDVAVDWAAVINEKYGIIAFDAVRFEQDINGGAGSLRPFYLPREDINHSDYVRVIRSAKELHQNYSAKMTRAIAYRASAKLATLSKQQFEWAMKARLEQ